MEMHFRTEETERWLERSGKRKDEGEAVRTHTHTHTHIVPYCLLLAAYPSIPSPMLG